MHALARLVPAASAGRGGERPAGRVPRRRARRSTGSCTSASTGSSGWSTARSWSTPAPSPWLDVDRPGRATTPTPRFPDLLVERKGEVAVTIHWRTAPDRWRPRRRRSRPRLRRGATASTRRCAGRMAVELRPPVPVDKGTVTAELVDRCARSRCSPATTPATSPRSTRSPGSPQPARSRTRCGSACARPRRRPEILDADVVVDGPRGLARAARRRSPTAISAAWLSDRSSSQVRGVCTRDELAEPRRRAGARSSAGHRQRVVQRVARSARRRTGAPRAPRRASSSNAPASGERQQHAVAPVHQRAFLGDEVQAVLHRVHEQHVVAGEAGDAALEVVAGVDDAPAASRRCAHRSFTRAAACSTSCWYARYSARFSRDAVEHARRTPPARATPGASASSWSYAMEAADDVLRRGRCGRCGRSACGRRRASSSSRRRLRDRVGRGDVGERVGVGPERRGERRRRVERRGRAPRGPTRRTRAPSARCGTRTAPTPSTRTALRRRRSGSTRIEFGPQNGVCVKCDDRRSGRAARTMPGTSASW